jgi:hypothetical protein
MIARSSIASAPPTRGLTTTEKLSSSLPCGLTTTEKLSPNPPCGVTTMEVTR